MSLPSRINKYLAQQVGNREGPHYNFLVPRAYVGSYMKMPATLPRPPAGANLLIARGSFQAETAYGAQDRVLSLVLHFSGGSRLVVGSHRFGI
jgi:hypothetical protein